MVRFFSSGLLIAVLACGANYPARSQAPETPPQAQEQKDQFFSGFITNLSDAQITVSRTVLGDKSSTRTFAITPETRIDGKPKVKSRVTVQFVPTEAGDRAVHIIVRAQGQKKQN